MVKVAKKPHALQRGLGQIPKGRRRYPAGHARRAQGLKALDGAGLKLKLVAQLAMANVARQEEHALRVLGVSQHIRQRSQNIQPGPANKRVDDLLCHALKPKTLRGHRPRLAAQALAIDKRSVHIKNDCFHHATAPLFTPFRIIHTLSLIVP